MQKTWKKMIKTLAHGYSSESILSEIFPMNTNMAGFGSFSKIFASLWALWTKEALALQGTDYFVCIHLQPEGEWF